MISKDLLTYYRSKADILTVLGSSNVFLHKAPSSAVMPWIIIEIPNPGKRNRLTVKFINPKTIMHIHADAEDQFDSMAIAETVLNYTDFYRGDMYDSKDLYLRCSIIYTMDGFSGSTRSTFQVTAQEKAIIIRPTPVVI